MPAQPRVVKVAGNLKNYPWGRKNGLTEFKVLASENPQAELWFGNHSAGPSFEVSTGEPLATVPAFPLLVKILAIGKPLSIQVHPNQKFAEQNFEKLKLSDKNGKDEILIALETVRAFAGIKSNNVRSQVAKSFQLNSFDKDFLSQCNEIFNLSKNQIEEKLTLLQNSFSDDTERKVFSYRGINTQPSGGTRAFNFGGTWDATPAAITSIGIYAEGYTFNGGTALLYGVK